MDKILKNLPHSTPEEAATLLYVFNSVYPITDVARVFNPKYLSD